MSAEITQRVAETDGSLDEEMLLRIQSGYRPVVLRGLARDWPAVAAARQSDETLAAYLKQFDNGKPAEALVGPPEIGGRFFYDDTMHGCNFQKRFGALSSLVDRLLAIRDVPNPDALYAGAATAGNHLPGWDDANRLPVSLPTAVARLWIGNATHVSTHFDESSNIAVVVGGRRRFTLFPPQQFENLYVGPLHFTIAGPPVSMVDIDAPDLDRYPRYAEAARHGLVADLEPGDAIYIPPIWWHNVQALAAFNVMVNYWWEKPNSVSALDTLMQGMTAIRDLPKPLRDAWRQWFERYVFDDDALERLAHLPEHVRTIPRPPSDG
ncbi:cupin-like domain-containing protein [Sphingomonas koreensis]|nr:cupin-like domain-containing protein [Sphingomonas koreensis]